MVTQRHDLHLQLGQQKTVDVLNFLKFDLDLSDALSVRDVDNPSGTEDNIRRISKTDCNSFKTPPPMKQCNT
jgi:hypothetical protein